MQLWTYLFFVGIMNLILQIWNAYIIILYNIVIILYTLVLYFIKHRIKKLYCFINSERKYINYYIINGSPYNNIMLCRQVFSSLQVLS